MVKDKEISDKTKDITKDIKINKDKVINYKLMKMKFLLETFLSMLLKMIFMHSLNKLEV